MDRHVIEPGPGRIAQVVRGFERESIAGCGQRISTEPESVLAIKLTRVPAAPENVAVLVSSHATSSP
jgi:hypothetical protein